MPNVKRRLRIRILHLNCQHDGASIKSRLTRGGAESKGGGTGQTDFEAGSGSVEADTAAWSAAAPQEGKSRKCPANSTIMSRIAPLRFSDHDG